MKDKLSFIRELEDMAFDASQARDLEYHGTLLMMLTVFAECEDFRFCEDCHKYQPRADFRGDYCEACTIAGQHLRESDDQCFEDMRYRELK